MSIRVKPNHHLFFLTVAFGIALGCAGCERAQRMPMPGSATPTPTSPAFADVHVQSVWARELRRYCAQPVVKSIERALRAFQRTLVTKIPLCVSSPEAEFVARYGCGHGSRTEIVKFVRPAEFRYGFHVPDGPAVSSVYEIIAISQSFEGTSARRLILGLEMRGRALHGHPRLLFSPLILKYDFLRLDSGECNEADVSRVPSTI